MKSVLAYRFSAFGDVLLCYPVLRAVLELNPDLEITFVTQSFLSSFFKDVPRLHVVGVDLKKDFKGFKGIYKLSRTLKANHAFEAVADLHQVTRTHLLNLFIGKKTFKINKGRLQKRAFMKHLNAAPLPHATARYLDVFKKMNLKVPQEISELKKYTFPKNELSDDLKSVLAPGRFNLGLAPYAKHFTKTWPKGHLEEFIKMNQESSSHDAAIASPENLSLNSSENLTATTVANLPLTSSMQIYLFGGPGAEAEHFAELAEKYSNVVNLAGRFKFKDEITLMQAMDQMVVMDSANMHLASLAGAPLISIWGGTHPDIGFYPLAKKAEILQVDRKDLPCRPCSVFGRSKCPKKHFKCMTEITPQVLMDSVNQSR